MSLSTEIRINFEIILIFFTVYINSFNASIAPITLILILLISSLSITFYNIHIISIIDQFLVNRANVGSIDTKSLYFVNFLVHF